MASRRVVGQCPYCSKQFAHQSSMSRHVRRCSNGTFAQHRRKACQQCVVAKARCDQVRPTCKRCKIRDIQCDYQNVDTQPPVSTPNSNDQVFAGVSLDVPSSTVAPFAGQPTSNHASGSVIVHRFLRVIRSWLKIMATHGTMYLPPVIHHLQRKTDGGGLPTPLANCFSLVKMWPDQTESTVALVQNTIQNEVRRLIREHTQYDELELLAAAQSILFLLSILLFNDPSHITLTIPESAQLLIGVWEVKRKLANTGLFLDLEMNHQVPLWKSWALVSAKRRTILGLHHIEYSWSLTHDYPTIECTEFKLLPAPAPRYLWYETDGHTWTQLYKRWLQLWDGNFYRMQELFDGVESRPLDERGELWLSEADEFGAAILSGCSNYGALTRDRC